MDQEALWRAPPRSMFHCSIILFVSPSSLLLVEVEEVTITHRCHFSFLKKDTTAHQFHSRGRNAPHRSHLVSGNNFIVRTFQPFLLALSSLQREALSERARGQLGSSTDKSSKHDGNPPKHDPLTSSVVQPACSGLGYDHSSPFSDKGLWCLLFREVRLLPWRSRSYLWATLVQRVTDRIDIVVPHAASRIRVHHEWAVCFAVCISH